MKTNDEVFNFNPEVHMNLNINVIHTENSNHKQIMDVKDLFVDISYIYVKSEDEKRLMETILNSVKKTDANIVNTIDTKIVIKEN